MVATDSAKSSWQASVSSDAAAAVRLGHGVDVADCVTDDTGFNGCPASTSEQRSDARRAAENNATNFTVGHRRHGDCAKVDDVSTFAVSESDDVEYIASQRDVTAVSAADVAIQYAISD